MGLAKELTFYVKNNIVQFSYRAADRRALGSTGISATTEQLRGDLLSKPDAAVIDRLKAVVHKYGAEMRTEGIPTQAAIVERMIAEALGRKPKREAPGETLWQLFGRYLDGVERGEILRDGKQYSHSWMHTAHIVAGHLRKSEAGSTAPAALREHHLQQFAAYVTSLGDEGKAKNTVATYVGLLAGVINGARRMHWFDGPVLDGKAFRPRAEKPDHPVYLTAEDQAAIGALDLPPHKAAARDLFLLGCQLGLRYSDLSRVRQMNIAGRVITINTRKTGKQVQVPMSTFACELWERLPAEVTVVTERKFLDLIEEFGKAAKLDDPVLFSRTQGGKRREEWVKKWELLGTHTMRRSFCTNAYKAGLPVPSIMRVSGHKTTESFLRYIRLTDEEHAQLLLEHQFFK